jgi:hypothetical protein
MTRKYVIPDRARREVIRNLRSPHEMLVLTRDVL